MNKNKKYLLYVILLLIAFLFFRSSYSFVNNKFTSIAPTFFLFVLGSAAILIILYFKKNSYLLNISKKSLNILILLFLLGLMIRTFTMPHAHLLSPDDYWYMDASKNYIQHGEAAVCENTLSNNNQCTVIKPIGQSALLTIPILAFGLNNIHLLFFNSIIGSLFIPLFFILIYLLFKKENIALWAAFLVALNPQQIMHSIYLESISSGIILLVLSLIFYIIYFEKKALLAHIIAILFFILAILTRTEYIVFIVPIVAVYLYQAKESRKKHFIIPLVLSVPLMYFAFIQIKVFFEITKSITSKNILISNKGLFNLGNLAYELGNFLWLLNKNYPVFLIILMVIGLIFCIRKYQKQTILIVFSFALILVSYLSFNKIFESKIRYYILPFLILLIFASAGISFILSEIKDRKYKAIICWLFILIIISIFGTQILILKTETKNNKIVSVETILPELIEPHISKDCSVIMPNPVYYTTVEFRTFSTKYALDNKEQIIELSKKECILFFENNFCAYTLNEEIHPVFEESTNNCLKIKDSFNLTKTKQIILYDYIFNLYNIG